MNYLFNKETSGLIERRHDIDADEACTAGFERVTPEEYRKLKANPEADISKTEIKPEAKIEKKDELKKMIEEINESEGAKDQGIKVNGRSGEAKIREFHSKYCIKSE